MSLRHLKVTWGNLSEEINYHPLIDLRALPQVKTEAILPTCADPVRQMFLLGTQICD